MKTFRVYAYSNLSALEDINYRTSLYLTYKNEKERDIWKTCGNPEER